MYSLSFDTKSLINTHPQLTEKSLVDFTNGLEVIDDHIRFRDGLNNSFCTRIWGHFTGEAELRQQVIDQNISASLSTVSLWLSSVQAAQIKSDLAIAKVSKKLLETREGVMRLHHRQNALDQQVENVLNKIEAIDVQYQRLHHRIEQVDAGRLAEQQLSAVFDKWKARRLHLYPPLVRLFLVFDELYWGDLGNYCRNFRPLNGEISRLIQQAKDKALVQLREDWLELKSSSEIAYPWQEDLVEGLKALEPPYQQTLAYLTNEADDGSRLKTPILWGLHQLANSPTKSTLETLNENKYLPVVLNAQNAVQRFTLDFEVRYANNQI